MTKTPKLKLPDWHKSYQILYFCPIETWWMFQSFGILFWNQQVFNNFSEFGKEMWNEKPIPTWKGNNPVEPNKKKFLKSKRGNCSNVWIYFEICNAFNIAQSLWKLWRVQVGTSKAWILEITQDSDDTGMKDNNESFSISIDTKEEKGNISIDTDRIEEK